MVGVRTWLAALVACLALTACADDPAPTQPEETAVEEPTPADPASTPAPTTVPGADSPAALASVADLAARLGVETDTVEVVAVQEITWSDGSRGCAKKGMLYTQALIDGSRITLRVGGTPYEYHSGGSGGPFLCERPTQ